MPSESESLVVGFFHLLRSVAKRARNPEPTQRAAIPRPVIGREWWACTDQQVRAAREAAERESALQERRSQLLELHADADAWERQFD
jgi:hypothetical protein